MRYDNHDLLENTIIVGILLALFAMVFGGIGCIAYIGVESAKNAPIKALCESVEGVYGGGRCFKNGEEVKYEPNED